MISFWSTSLRKLWQFHLGLVLLSAFVGRSTGSGHGTTQRRPNIIIIMADDMGFDDVSFRGSNHFLTPNIDALAYSGIILQNLYTPSMCTPSRAALLTGKYPIKIGMQHYVIVNDQPWSLPINETTMAQIFHDHGYYTSLIGKWHLGMSRRAYTPTYRGFDHHYGYLGAYVDYYDQSLYDEHKNYSRGHDFRSNLTVDRSRRGTYVTDLLTDAAVKLITRHDTNEQPLFLLLSHLAPHSGNEDAVLQAPDEEVAKFSYIANEDRRIFAAMMSVLDKSVGRIVDALAAQEMLDNSVLMFVSDNGGPTVGMHSTTASNYPLRGQKNSPWEGGIRSSAAMWSPEIETMGRVWKQRVYMTDLLPTLASAARIDLGPIDEDLDGLNLWPAIKYGYEAVEREYVHNIDEDIPYVAYAKGKWKYINGTTSYGLFDGWLGWRYEDDSPDEIDPRSHDYETLIRNTTVWRQLRRFSNRDINIAGLRANASVRCQFRNYSEGIECNPLTAPCLFDLEIDPCEQNNLYEQHKNSNLLHDMLERVEYFRGQTVPPNNRPADVRCDPKNFGGEWTWWEDLLEERSAARSRAPLQIISSEILLLLFFVIGKMLIL